MNRLHNLIVDIIAAAIGLLVLSLIALAIVLSWHAIAAGAKPAPPRYHLELTCHGATATATTTRKHELIVVRIAADSTRQLITLEGNGTITARLATPPAHELRGNIAVNGRTRIRRRISCG